MSMKLTLTGPPALAWGRGLPATRPGARISRNITVSRKKTLLW